VIPTARGMCAEGTPFRGVIFAGLMIKDGQVRPARQQSRGPGGCAPELPAPVPGTIGLGLGLNLSRLQHQNQLAKAPTVA
jgi:hypothetical protein